MVCWVCCLVTWTTASDQQLAKFAAEAKSQIAAARQADPDANVEWHFSDKDVAEAMQTYFDQEGIDVTVVYTPKV